jgi:hypothetical protein
MSSEERVSDSCRCRCPVGSLDADLACTLSQHKDATVILQSLWRSPKATTTDGVDIVVDSWGWRPVSAVPDD